MPKREGERASGRRTDWSSEFSWAPGMPIMGNGGGAMHSGSDAVGRGSPHRPAPLKKSGSEWSKIGFRHIAGISSLWVDLKFSKTIEHRAKVTFRSRNPVPVQPDKHIWFNHDDIGSKSYQPDRESGSVVCANWHESNARYERNLMRNGPCTRSADASVTREASARLALSPSLV